MDASGNHLDSLPDGIEVPVGEATQVSFVANETADESVELLIGRARSKVGVYFDAALGEPGGCQKFTISSCR